MNEAFASLAAPRGDIHGPAFEGDKRLTAPDVAFADWASRPRWES
jgi:hypothetical protein